MNSTATEFTQLFEQREVIENKMLSFIASIDENDKKFIKSYKLLLESDNNSALDFIDQHFTVDKILQKFKSVTGRMINPAQAEFIQKVFDRREVQIDYTFIKDHARLLLQMVICHKFTGDIALLFEHGAIIELVKEDEFLLMNFY